MTRQDLEHFEQLAAGYFDDTLEQAEQQQLAELMRGDDRLVQRFAEIAQVYQMIESEVAYREQAGHFDRTPTSEDTASAIAMADLAGRFEDGVHRPIDFLIWRESQKVKQAEQRRRTLMKRFALAGGVAAAVAVAVVVLAGLLNPPPTPVEQVADQSSTSPPTVPDSPAWQPPGDSRPVVATLTGERDALWDRYPGDNLYAGQRFTLTQGFAEITTRRGAVVILEAPAIVELLASDNALRLHAGKLVGICEADSSKGFIVRTPHMNVTDLGTRFGVDADAKITEVHVFEGEIQAKRLGGSVGAEPVKLTANQSARTSIDADVITVVDSDLDRFASLMPEVKQLVSSTGQGLAVGDTDPDWRVIQIDGQSLETPLAMRVFDDPPTREFGPPDAKWIGINTSDLQWDQRQVRYTILTQIEIPDSAEMNSASLLMRFHPDDEMTSLFVNDQKIDLPTNHVMKRPVYEIRITDHLVRGSNKIKLEVTDRKPPHQQDNYAGIKATWQLVTRQTPFEGGHPAP